MAGFRFRADDIPGVGIDHQSGDVIIVARRDDGDELELVFASEEIPQLGLSLASAFAALSTATSPHAPRTHLVLAGADIRGMPSHLTLETTLSSGLPVTYSIPLHIAEAMRDRLIALLGKP